MIPKQWLYVALCMTFAGTMCFAEEETKKSPAPAEQTETAKPVEDNTQPIGKGNRLPHARLRLELTPLSGVHSGIHERTGDWAIRTNVDYEIPIVDHLTIGPRLIPLMYYDQQNDNSLFLGGIGVIFRGYSKGREEKGWYGEIGLHLLAQTGKFEGNSGTLNFMEELGFGYMFDSNWHIAAKVNHISNADLAEDNAGVNNFGLGFGYSFKLHGR